MTETEWRTSENPHPMLHHLRGFIDDRKLRLFMAACCSTIEDRLPSTLREPRFTSLIEALAEGRAPEDELLQARIALENECNSVQEDLALLKERAVISAFLGALRGDIAPAQTVATTGALIPGWVVTNVVSNVSNTLVDSSCDFVVTEDRLNILLAANQRLTELLREIVGNPFQAPFQDCDWRTTHVIDFARTIYDQRCYDAMPILADALEEAGCDNEEVLQHCREQKEHLRGCWVIDEILERKTWTSEPPAPAEVPKPKPQVSSTVPDFGRALLQELFPPLPQTKEGWMNLWIGLALAFVTILAVAQLAWWINQNYPAG